MPSTRFKIDESFRGEYKFRNSPEAIARFPFPFFGDHYDYSMNLEPHVRKPGGIYQANFDIDDADLEAFEG